MTLVSLWCSTTNPADGTTVGTPAGIATVTTGSGTTRVWRAADASQANTGIDITAGGGTDAFRTTAFTANASAAVTWIMRTPTANPSVAATLLGVRYASGVSFRVQWSASGQFQLTDAGSSIRVIATAGTLSLNTRYIVKMWFTEATTTTGVAHVVVQNLAGATVATYDATTINLGTNAFTQFDIDPGGTATNYGVSEFQYNDGATSFIPPYTAVTGSSTGTASETGTMRPTIAVTGSSAGIASETANMRPGIITTGSSVGTASESSTIRPTMTMTGSSLGLASETCSITPRLTASGSSAGTSTEFAGITTTEQMTGFSVGTATESSTTRITVAMTGSSTVTAVESARISAETIAVTASSVGTSADTVTDVRSEAHVAAGSSVGAASETATLTSHVALTGSSVGSASEQNHMAPAEALTSVTTGTNTETSAVSYAVIMTGTSAGAASDIAKPSVAFTASGASVGVCSDATTTAAFLISTATGADFGTSGDAAVAGLPTYLMQAADYGMAVDTVRARINFTSTLILVEFLTARWTMQVHDSRWKAETGRNRWELR